VGAAAKSISVGEIARRRHGWGGERARVKFSAVGTSRACETMPHATVDASDMAPRIGQNISRTNFFAAPTRIVRLLEELIFLHRYIGGYYSAG
jgi:hypothetical protein